MSDIVEDKIRQALANPTPYAGLVDIVLDLKNANVSQYDVYKIFGAYYLKVNDLDLEFEADAIADVLDYICGHVGGHLLFGSDLSPEQTRQAFAELKAAG